MENNTLKFSNIKYKMGEIFEDEIFELVVDDDDEDYVEDETEEETEEEMDEEDEDDDGEEEDEDADGEEEIYVKSTEAWRRARLESEDYTSDHIKTNAINMLKKMAQDNIELDFCSLFEKYKIKYGNTNNGYKWVVNEIENILKNTKNKNTIRTTKICSELFSKLELTSNEIESTDGDDPSYTNKLKIVFDESGDVSKLLMGLFGLKEEEVDDKTPGNKKINNNLAVFKKLLSSINNTNGNENHTISFFNSLDEEKQKYYLDILTGMKTKIQNTNSDEIPYLLRLVDFNIDDTSKQTIFEHVSAFEKMSASSSEYNKKRNLVKAIKQLPFGRKAKLPDALEEAISENNETCVSTRSNGKRARTIKDKKLTEYLKQVSLNMDRKIYGHKETKNQTMRLIASMVSNGSAKGGHCFAMTGPPGVGKTQIAEEIANALGRPCVKINMGGASNGDDYVGHGYTYEGSTYGLIARAMMNAGCENPVIIFDELDKVSRSNKGEEINNILIHITDATQNHTFQDKYLAGINIDLSKVVMIFSMNDRSNVSPILLDRMKVINVGGYKISDKVVIAQKYLVPAVKKDLGYKDCNYTFDEVVIKDMINQYTFEGGVRKLKELITDIFMEINLRKMTGQTVDGKKPTENLIINKRIVRDDIFKDKHHIQHVMVSKTNQVGLVNGLWANSYGIGGLIPVEAHMIPSAVQFDLQLTGMQGDVMKESMKVAKTVAWRMLPEQKKTELMRNWKKNGASGIHVHCPDGSTPKDGPSAGGAITTCLISLLSNVKIDQSFAMTGEINLQGKITAIGGLEEKTFGAITAGVKTVLYPQENQRDADKIKEKFPELFDPTSKTYIEMIPVTCIEEILERVLIK